MTPHRTVQLCRWALYLALPVTAFLLVAWGFRLIPETRPFLMLMAYLTAVFTCMALGLTMTLAQLHMATVDAFSAGYRTAMKDAVQRGVGQPLRSVE